MTQAQQEDNLKTRHAPHGACELKFLTVLPLAYTSYVTLPTERVS